MTIYVNNTNLGNETILPTRIWAGGNTVNNNRLTFNIHDNILPRGNTTIVSGEDLHIKTYQLGQHTIARFDNSVSPDRDRLFLGNINLINSTVDIHNPTGLLANVVAASDGSSVILNIANPTEATDLANLINNANIDGAVNSGRTNILGARIFNGSELIKTFNSTTDMTATADNGVVTITTTGNTELTPVQDLPTRFTQIQFYTNTAATFPVNPNILALNITARTDNIIGGSNGTSFNWRDVNLFYTGREYAFIGNFHERSLTRTGPSYYPTYLWNGVQIEGDVNSDVATTAESYMNIISMAVNDNSVFNNVSFWNGEDIQTDLIRGGTWQTTSNARYVNTLFGPIGTPIAEFAVTPVRRMIARYGNQGRTDLTPTNHYGLVTNLDYRSLGQVTAAQVNGAGNLNWFFDIDAAANVYFVNWLPGRPIDSNRFTFSNLFNNASTVMQVSAPTRTATSAEVIVPNAGLATSIVSQIGSLDAIRRIEFVPDRTGTSRLSLNSDDPITAVVDGTTNTQINFTLVNNTDLGTLTNQDVTLVRLYDSKTGGNEIGVISLNQAGAQARVCIATNQQPNIGTSTSVEHFYTFTQTAINSGVYRINDIWDTTAPPNRITNRYLQHRTQNNALMFTNQWFDQLGNGQNAPNNGNPLTYAEDISILNSPTYRKYSWLQQQDNTTWGRQISISVPADNIDDDTDPEAIANVRAGGYDHYTGNGWETSTDISDPIDMITTASGFNSATAAFNHYTTLGTRSGSDLHIGSKALSFLGINMSGTINALNDRLQLLHDFTGSRIDFPGSLSFTGVNAAPLGVITSRTGTHTFGIGTGGIVPDTFITGVQADDGIAFSGAALTVVDAAELEFQYRAGSFNFGGTGRLGNFTAINTTTSNTLRNLPSSIPAQMVMTGTITHNSATARTINFEPGANVSGIRLEAPGAGELIITGANAANFANVGTNVRILGSVAVTFPRAGKVVVGRMRGNDFTTSLTSPLDGTVINVTAGQVTQLSGADFNPSDMVIIWYRPQDGSPTTNTERYRLARTEFLFGAATAQTITAERIPEPLIRGVNGVFTPTGTPSFTETYGTAPTGGIIARMNIGGDLNLVRTKEMFIWLSDVDAIIESFASNNAPDNAILIDTNGISVNANVLTLARQGGNQNEITGVSVTSRLTTRPSGSTRETDPTAVLVQNAVYNERDRYLIPVNAQGLRDYIVAIVPDGITIPEVTDAVSAVPDFQQILTQVEAMRTNRLLGIRPQSPTSGGDFSV